MVAKGQKRKLQREDEGVGSAWDTQLQSVLDISMDKFHRDQALVEPSLLRSVLINNTLRQVQSEVRAQVESLTPTKSHTHAALGPDFPRVSSSSEHTSPLLSLNAENLEDDFMAWTSEEDFSLSSAISAILKDLDTVVDGGQGPCVSQRPPLCSVENRAADSRCPSSVLRTSDVRTEAVFSGCPQDVTLDKLLLDIDTSLFEPEVNLLQGFSVAAEDLVKYLPSLSKPPSAPSLSSSSHGQAAWEIQEIEHVMDILMRTCPQS